MENGGFVNYYDLLMLSPTADLKVLEAAVRVMLARYNPKNAETGDEHHFELVKRAYLTLSDPHHREAYDKKLAERGQHGLREVAGGLSAAGLKIEKKKREGIVALLYTRMMNEPQDPGLTTPQIEDQLDLEHEEIGFAYWVLREKGLIARTANGNFCITVEGVEWAEQGGLSHFAEASAAPTIAPASVPAPSPQADPNHAQEPIMAAAGGLH